MSPAPEISDEDVKSLFIDPDEDEADRKRKAAVAERAKARREWLRTAVARAQRTHDTHDADYMVAAPNSGVWQRIEPPRHVRRLTDVRPPPSA